MSERYNLQLSKPQKKLFKIWDLDDPISDWEQKRNTLIEEIQ